MTRDSSHDTVHELLPWYANQTLPRDESALVEQHLSRCTQCMQELQHLYGVVAALKETDAAAPPVMESFDRTLAAIDDWEQTRQRGLSYRLTAWFRGLWTPSVPMARIVFAAQFAIILLMVGMILLPRWNRPSYSTLSSGDSGAAAGTKLSVVFEPTVTEATMRQLLMDVGGTVVSGPSAQGVYVIQLTGVTDTDPRVETAIAKLRSNATAVQFVERQP